MRVGRNSLQLLAAPVRPRTLTGGLGPSGQERARGKGHPHFLPPFAQQPSLHPHGRGQQIKQMGWDVVGSEGQCLSLLCEDSGVILTHPASFLPVSVPGLSASQKPLTQHHQQGPTKSLPTDSLPGASPPPAPPPTRDTSHPQKGQSLHSFQIKDPVTARDPLFPVNAHAPQVSCHFMGFLAPCKSSKDLQEDWLSLLRFRARPAWAGLALAFLAAVFRLPLSRHLCRLFEPDRLPSSTIIHLPLQPRSLRPGHQHYPVFMAL